MATGRRGPGPRPGALLLDRRRGARRRRRQARGHDRACCWPAVATSGRSPWAARTTPTSWRATCARPCSGSCEREGLPAARPTGRAPVAMTAADKILSEDRTARRARRAPPRRAPHRAHQRRLRPAPRRTRARARGGRDARRRPRRRGERRRERARREGARTSRGARARARRDRRGAPVRRLRHDLLRRHRGSSAGGAPARRARQGPGLHARTPCPSARRAGGSGSRWPSSATRRSTPRRSCSTRAAGARETPGSHPAAGHAVREGLRAAPRARASWSRTADLDARSAGRGPRRVRSSRAPNALRAPARGGGGPALREGQRPGRSATQPDRRVPEPPRAARRGLPRAGALALHGGRGGRHGGRRAPDARGAGPRARRVPRPRACRPPGPSERAAMARGIGSTLRGLHTARFFHPDLHAWHVLVDGSAAGGRRALTFLDLMRLERGGLPRPAPEGGGGARRARALAARGRPAALPAVDPARLPGRHAARGAALDPCDREADPPPGASGRLAQRRARSAPRASAPSSTSSPSQEVRMATRKLFLAGAWSDGVGARPVRLPVRRIGRRRGGTRGRRRTRPGRRGRRTPLRPTWPRSPAHERVRILEKAREHCLAPRRDGRVHRPGGGQADRARAPRGDALPRHPRRGGRASRAPRGRGASISPGTRRATGRLGLVRRVPGGAGPRDHAVQLPAEPRRAQGGARRRGRLPDRGEAGEPDAVARRCCWPRSSQAAGLPDGALSVLPCPGHRGRGPRARTSASGSSPSPAPTSWAGRSRDRAKRRRVTLELGGNAAVWSSPTRATSSRSRSKIAAAAYGYAGQSCISVQRVLVHRRRLRRAPATRSSRPREAIRSATRCRRDHLRAR